LRRETERLTGKDMSFLALIPARGGSKGIPRKNIKPFLDKPLIAWTIEAAIASSLFQKVIVSTEDAEIADIAKFYGAEAPFLRPPELATDTASTVSVVHHAVEWLLRHEGQVPDFVMILEPTSPARRSFHIVEAGQMLEGSGADAVASISEVPHHFVPQKVLHLQPDNRISGISGTPIRDMVHRRQDLAKCYAFNGLIFSCRTPLVLESPPTIWGDFVLGYLVDQSYSVDLDIPNDWVVSEARVRQLLERESQRN